MKSRGLRYGMVAKYKFAHDKGRDAKSCWAQVLIPKTISLVIEIRVTSIAV
jgi:hypothetical protein